MCDVQVIGWMIESGSQNRTCILFFLIHHDYFQHCTYCISFYVIWADMSENKLFAIVVTKLAITH